MTLQDLKYLVALADLGSFREAAERCFVTQPTLSTQLKKLEAHLGLHLAERTNKSVRLTPEGAAVVERARRMLEIADEIEELAKELRDPFSTPVRIGMIATLGPYLLPHLLPALEAELPELKIVLQEGLTDDLLAALEDHRLDCVLLALPLRRSGLEARALFEEPFWFACRADHPLAARARIRPSDLAGEPMLLLAEGHCLRDQALSICNSGQGTEQADYRATSLETLRNLVQGGFGSTLAPQLALGALQGLCAVPMQAGAASRTVGLAWRKSSPRAELLRRIGDLIEAGAPRWLRGQALRAASPANLVP
ncbi:MAG: LysR family transcriptional regulator [Acidobacteria bacterium]|nr:LysR family transcriptional regulator [Acidobacteriota bacterium]